MQSVKQQLLPFINKSQSTVAAVCLAWTAPTPNQISSWSVEMFVSYLTSQHHASISQGWFCSDKCKCCHTENKAAYQTCYLTQSQYTDPRPTSPSADPVTADAWQGSHWSINYKVTGMTRSVKITTAKYGIEHRSATHVCAHECKQMWVYMCVHMWTYKCGYVYGCVFVCMHMHACAHIHILCVCVQSCVCMKCVCVHIHALQLCECKCRILHMHACFFTCTCEYIYANGLQRPSTGCCNSQVSAYVTKHTSWLGIKHY